MPLYEYQCTACGHRFEKIQKFSDAPLRECPSCGGVLEKLLSSPAIQFKGSGWYITDYAKSSKAETKSSGSTSSSETKAETKSDSKPADSSASTSTPAKPSSTESKS